SIYDGTRPRAGSWTWVRERRLDFWASTFGASARCGGAGGRSTRPSSCSGGVAREAQGAVPTLRLSARGAGDRGDQSDPARLGELLSDRELGSVLGLRDELGREEGAAPFNAGEESCGLRLGEVEYGGALRGAGVVP